MPSDPRLPGASRRTVHLVSLGCAKNRVDSEVLLGLLRGAGYRPVADPLEATLVVVNTCSFIEAAREESVDAILEAAAWKAEGQCQTLVVAGCFPQRHAGELAEALPEVDKFLGTANLEEILALLEGAQRVRVAPGPSFLYDHRHRREPSLGRHTAYVKIAEGCHRPCAFCAVPGIRGPLRSREPGSVITEVQGLVARGVREINLVAQDLTAYGRDRGEAGGLADLVSALAGVPGLTWLRLLYAYPSEVDDRLIGLLGQGPVVPYLDVPVQHVDDGVLRAMRRGYTGRDVRRLLARLREAVPDIALRTTLLTGHPGETEAAFEQLVAFVEAARLDHVGVFAYSPEAGTPALDLPDPVPGAVARERAQILMDHQRAVSRERLARRVGQALGVMLEGLSPESDLLRAGRHAGQAPEVDGLVHLADVPAALEAGCLIEADVEQAGDYDLVARFRRVVEPAAR